MPSIYDTILGEDPLSAARAEAQARLQAEKNRSEALMQSRRAGQSREQNVGEQAGIIAGNITTALGQKFGLMDKPADPVETSPEVVQARQNAGLVKSLQGIESDPASAEWATAAAAQAKANGREDLAFQLLGEAAQRRKSEAKAGVAAEQQALKDRRATINTLPSAQKFSLIVNDREATGKMYNLKGKALDSFVKDAADSLATIRDKNRAELNKIKPVNPANVTGGDLTSVQSTMESKGFNQDAFDTSFFGDGEDAHGQFANMIADHARTEQEIRARQGGETLPLDQITSELLDTLEANGTFQRTDDFFGDGTSIGLKEDFKADDIRNMFKQRLDTLQPTGGTQAPPAVSTQSAPAAVNAPTVDFDFTK